MVLEIAPAQRALLRHLRLLASRVTQPDFFGSYRSSFRGTGLDFSEIKPFEPGDEVRFIDWNVTARAGRPHVRVYNEERAIRIVLALDVSASMGAPGLGRPKLEVARDVALAVAMAAVAGGDRVGWLTFDREVRQRAPLRSGRRALWHMLRQLSQLRAGRCGTDYAALIGELARAQRRRAVIILLSDFLLSPETTDPAPMIGLLRTLQQRHEVIMVAINDPLEWEMVDAGLVWTHDGESGNDAVLLDTSSAALRDEYRRRGRAIRSFRRHLWRQADLEQLELSTDQDVVPALLDFMRSRSRRKG